MHKLAYIIKCMALGRSEYIRSFYTKYPLLLCILVLYILCIFKGTYMETELYYIRICLVCNAFIMPDLFVYYARLVSAIMHTRPFRNNMIGFKCFVCRRTDEDVIKWILLLLMRFVYVLHHYNWIFSFRQRMRIKHTVSFCCSVAAAQDVRK